MRTTTLGWAKIVRHADGSTSYDKHSLRGESFDGEDFGDDYGDDDLGDDDLGDDDLGDDDMGDDYGADDLGDDDLGDDDMGDDDMGDDDVGASPRGRRNQLARLRAQNRRLRRQARHGGRHGRHGRRAVKWQKTAVSGSQTFAGASVAGTITIIPASWLKLEDITFTGTTAGTVKAITVGDKLLWSSSTGIPATIFATSGFVRGMLKGTNARPGVPILIDVVSGAAETITSTLFARKPSRC